MPPEPLPAGDGFTLVHTADLHLGSGMRIAKRLGRADDLRDATYEALDNLVALVEREEATILTLGGDLFDEPNLLNPGPRYRLASALERIPQTRVALVRGNHDHHHRDAPRVHWPDHVFEFEGNRKTMDLGPVRIHGVSYSQAREANSLLPRYPDPDPSRFDIGLLHANVGGVTGHADYAPCTVTQLREKGYDMWLLGHIHKRQVLCDDPLILYPGNLQGRDIGETGEKTAEVIEVSASGVVTHRPEPVHSVLWERMDIDVSGCEDDQQVIDRTRRRLDERRRGLGARGIIVRIRLTGVTAAHPALNRVDTQGSWADETQGLINEESADASPFLLVDKIDVATRTSFDLERLLASDDISGLLVRLGNDSGLRREVLAELADEGPAALPELEAMAADLWDDAVQSALVRLKGGAGGVH